MVETFSLRQTSKHIQINEVNSELLGKATCGAPQGLGAKFGNTLYE